MHRVDRRVLRRGLTGCEPRTKSGISESGEEEGREEDRETPRGRGPAHPLWEPWTRPGQGSATAAFPLLQPLLSAAGQS